MNDTTICYNQGKRIAKYARTKSKIYRGGVILRTSGTTVPRFDGNVDKITALFQLLPHQYFISVTRIIPHFKPSYPRFIKAFAKMCNSRFYRSNNVCGFRFCNIKHCTQGDYLLYSDIGLSDFDSALLLFNELFTALKYDNTDTLRFDVRFDSKGAPMTLNKMTQFVESLHLSKTALYANYHKDNDWTFSFNSRKLLPALISQLFQQFPTLTYVMSTAPGGISISRYWNIDKDRYERYFFLQSLKTERIKFFQPFGYKQFKMK
ncbi:MAG: hypothetical protein RRZ83_00375 [Alistipes sp.]